MQNLINQIFDIHTEEQFESTALRVFQLQAEKNIVYQTFLKHIGVNIPDIKRLIDIPFLPISFFKTHRVILQEAEPQVVFKSSGTTQSITSNHFVANTALYKRSFLNGFTKAYGSPADYIILALLPGYIERGNSSLVYMVNELISLTEHPLSGFYMHNQDALYDSLVEAEATERKILLIGVTHALIQFSRKYNFHTPKLVVMETGGMKGQGPEYIRQEVHKMLGDAFQTPLIHSEYGMTELLSQAYSFGNGIFEPASTMRLLIRDTHDPKQILSDGLTGAINVIDLANVFSCSFIETQDLGRKQGNSFEVLGRFDNADVRGCNLMAN